MNQQDENMQKWFSKKKITRCCLAMIILVNAALLIINQYGMTTGETTDRETATGWSIRDRERVTSRDKSASTVSISYFEDHEPITITNDVELAIVAKSGSGTENDPYLLGGWNITTNTSHGILVQNTTSYFVIRDCRISTSFDENNDYGISIDSVEVGTVRIINNTCQDNGLGISITDSSNCTVVNNTCQNGMIGILISSSNNAIVVNNTCNRFFGTRSGGGGIYISDSVNATVANNTCQNNHSGIRIVINSNSTVINNTCQNNYSGISIGDSDNCIVANNSLNGDGLLIDGPVDVLLSLSIVNNQVNGLSLGFLTNEYNRTVTTSYGHLIMVNCTNVVVKDQNYSNTTRGIALHYCSRVQLVNNTSQNNKWDGIGIYDSVSSIVANNTCQNNSVGINIDDSVSSIVANNTCQNNSVGINIDDSVSSIVANNTCQNNEWSGLYIDNSENSIVANNSFHRDGLLLEDDPVDVLLSLSIVNNQVNGHPLGFLTNEYNLTVTTSYGQLIMVNCIDMIVKEQNCSNIITGIALHYCSRVQLMNNTCQNNEQDGIGIYDSAFSIVANNTCQNNEQVGIRIYDSASSIVANNTCQNNGWSGIRIYHSASSIVANNTCQNNGWSGINIYDSASSVVANNTCQNNEQDGISIHSSDLSIIYRNLIVNNQRGLNLKSTAVVLYHNFFISNSVQAIDDGTGNRWYAYETREGNYWSDYSGIGPYEISGSAGASDPYPINDLDGDGIPDFWESQYGLDFMNPADVTLDKDNDGLPNIWEFTNGFNASDPSDALLDKDNDGITNLYEYQHGLLVGTDDAELDKDNDGMPNLWEFTNGFNASDPSDAILDKDNDGMNNLYEYHHGLLVGTDDAALDKDNDGIPNLWEFTNDFNASDPSDALLDKDNDGMSNLYECQHSLLAGTDDAALDKDNDGMPNLWEFTNGFNASNPSDANADPDGDGVTNVDEYRGGSDPNDPNSFPLVSLSIYHLITMLILLVVLLIIFFAIVVRMKARERMIQRLKAPDLATAAKVLVTGFKDYPAYVRAEKDVKEYIESGNEACHQGDHETAIQQYEIALYISERLANLPLIAETVFIIASIQKEEGTLAAKSHILQRFPRPSHDDPVIEALHAMFQVLQERTD
ncbi:MAG: NosD domain-containing protein [Candidatus Hodarchaeales archaeon]|jgi:parallel beta-helix repeat protein